MACAFAPVAAPALPRSTAPPRLCARQAPPLPAPRQRCSACLQPPPASPASTASSAIPSDAAVRAAADGVHYLFGDSADENQEYHRWRMAQADINDSRLRDELLPGELVYGEFDLLLLGKSLQYALASLHLDAADGPARTFVDIGSGYGRCVLAAARVLGPDWACCGLEIVPGMHDYAASMLKKDRAAGGLPARSDVRFVQGDFAATGGEAEAALREASLLFCFSTTWPSGGTPFLATLTGVLAQRLRPGALVMTVDKQLVAGEALAPDASRFELLHQMDGPNRSCGESTVYFHRFVRPQP